MAVTKKKLATERRAQVEVWLNQICEGQLVWHLCL